MRSIPTAHIPSCAVLTVEQLADRYSVTPQTVRDWRYKGIAPRAFKIGKSVLFRLEDVQEWERANLEPIEKKEDAF